ncbi:MAG: 3-phosphoshikimate 1-carboxyvinyltransferase, partial [Cyclobacteriaceae bacterium]|nr:3-phosphoshikimate 1-carboxyvinyltransferase [Cyclobacteriaceae bacterium]
MKSLVRITKHSRLSGIVPGLPASKSISNRALILNALSGLQSEISNLSNANDTVLMQRLLQSPDVVLDVEDAGTTMRFLTAYCSVAGHHKIL